MSIDNRVNSAMSSMTLASALLLGACASTGFVEKKIEAAEQRQAAVDYAQNTEIAKLNDGLSQALDRVNKALSLRDPGNRMSSAVSSLIVGFDTNSARITADDKARLAELALVLLESGEEFHLEVQGHTDATGSPRANAEVGAKRADMVRMFLHEKGIPLRRMSTISFGDTVPLLTDAEGKAQAANRRVEIIVFK